MRQGLTLDMVGLGRPGGLRVLNHQMLNGHDTRVIGSQWCGAVNRRCGSVREDPGRASERCAGRRLLRSRDKVEQGPGVSRSL